MDYFQDILFFLAAFTIYGPQEIYSGKGKMKICCFAGHANIPNKEEGKIKLRTEIINLIENEKVTTFYSGGKGDFDWLCAKAVDELRKDYPFIKSYWVLSYMPKEKDDYTESVSKIFDDTVYPNIENVPQRFAIVKRNKWLVNNSDFLIAYVEHDWGGAYKTLEYAEKRRKIKIINIAKER